MSNSTPTKPSGLRKVLRAGAYVTFLGVALAGGTAMGWLGKSKVAASFVQQTLSNTSPQEIFGNKQAVTLLILGCDEDVSYGGTKVLRKQARSDSMLVAKLDFESNRITGVGIPRDLLVQLPGYRSQKVNAYHAIGGKELAQKAAEQVLGISIDRTLTLDYESFIKMVDMVGGVDVFVPKRMKYTDKRANPPLYIDFKPGRQHMDGYQAMCFVRFRHSDDTFHRQARQVDFMLALKETMRKKPQLIGEVADQAIHVLGDGLSSSEMAAIARFAQRIPKDGIKFGTVPVLPAGDYNFKLDEAKLPKALEEYNLADPVRVSLR